MGCTHSTPDSHVNESPKTLNPPENRPSNPKLHPSSAEQQRFSPNSQSSQAIPRKSRSKSRTGVPNRSSSPPISTSHHVPRRSVSSGPISRPSSNYAKNDEVGCHLDPICEPRMKRSASSMSKVDHKFLAPFPVTSILRKSSGKVNQYTKVSKIGEGATSSVYHYKDDQGKSYAVKKCNRFTLQKQRQYFNDANGHLQMRTGLDELYHEIKVLQYIHSVALNHERHLEQKLISPMIQGKHLPIFHFHWLQYIAQVFEIVDDPDYHNVYIFMEYGQHTLSQWDPALYRFSLNTLISEPVARIVLRDVLYGLAALREIGVIHMDIKPDNIVIMSDGTAKLIDFGKSVVLPWKFPAIDEALQNERDNLAIQQYNNQQLQQTALTLSHSHRSVDSGEPLTTRVAAAAVAATPSNESPASILQLSSDHLPSLNKPSISFSVGSSRNLQQPFATTLSNPNSAAIDQHDHPPTLAPLHSVDTAGSSADVHSNHHHHHQQQHHQNNQNDIEKQNEFFSLPGSPTTSIDFSSELPVPVSQATPNILDRPLGTPHRSESKSRLNSASSSHNHSAPPPGALMEFSYSRIQSDVIDISSLFDDSGANQSENHSIHKSQHDDDVGGNLERGTSYLPPLGPSISDAPSLSRVNSRLVGGNGSNMSISSSNSSFHVPQTNFLSFAVSRPLEFTTVYNAWYKHADMTGNAGTPFFWSPECCNGAYNGFDNDLWALAVTMFCAVCGQLPFLALENNYDATVHRTLQLIMKARLDWPCTPKTPPTSKHFRQLICWMLQRKPLNRPSIDMCEQHPWIHESFHTDTE